MSAVGGVPVAHMTGLTLFVCAALAASEPDRQRALRAAVLPLAGALKAQTPAREGDQAVLDAVCEVMPRGWRPGQPWKQHLIRQGRYDLVSW